jgi:hypothetical protein
MTVQSVSIATEDVTRSVRLYVEQPGFNCLLQSLSFLRARLGAVDFMPGQSNAHLSWQGARFTGSTDPEVDNVDEFWESLKGLCTHHLSNRDYAVRRA